MNNSFNNLIKQQITSQTIKNPCCKKAFITAIVLTKGEVKNQTVSIHLSNLEYQEWMSNLIASIYQIDPILSHRRGAGAYSITFTSKSVSRLLSSINELNLQELFVCKQCKQSFMQGIIFSCGFFSKTNETIKLEICPNSNKDLLLDILSKLDIPAKASKRKDKDIIFIHTLEGVGDILAQLGFMEEYFQLQNDYFKKQLNSETNRQNNCTIANINRSVKSQSNLLQLIEQAMNQNTLSRLPEELQETAKMRYQYSDYSLSQLASMFTPSLTKSGLNHRLKKIEELLK